MSKPPIRQKNEDVRSREHLTPQEVTRLQKAAATIGRHGKRDALMIRVTYIHGLRASELCGLLWSDVDFDNRRLFVRRLKGSHDATHPLQTDVIRALKAMTKPEDRNGFVFCNERGTPISPNSFGKIVRRAGEVAKIGMVCHPHQLRHSTGYKLANEGTDTRTIQGYLGHASIANTVRYTALSETRFKNIWKD